MTQKRLIFSNLEDRKANILKGFIQDEIDIEKGGPGSRGGKIIGYTKSGKPIYANAKHENHKNFTIAEHNDAIEAHQKVRDNYHNNPKSTDRDKQDNDTAYEQQKHHIGAKNYLMRDMTPAEARDAAAESEKNNIKKSSSDEITKALVDEFQKGLIDEDTYIERLSMIEKGKKGMVGEVREWNGKKFKKQGNGKWMIVSEHGLTKKEHENQDQKYRDKFNRRIKHTPAWEELAAQSRLHEAAAKELDDKEYSNKEVGLNEPSREENLSGQVMKIKDKELQKTIRKHIQSGHLDVAERMINASLKEESQLPEGIKIGDVVYLGSKKGSLQKIESGSGYKLNVFGGEGEYTLGSKDLSKLKKKE